MEVKTYLIYLLEAIGALILIAPVIIGAYKSILTARYSAKTVFIAEVAKAVSIAMKDTMKDREKNTDHNERD